MGGPLSASRRRRDRVGNGRGRRGDVRRVIIALIWLGGFGRRCRGMCGAREVERLLLVRCLSRLGGIHRVVQRSASCRAWDRQVGLGMRGGVGVEGDRYRRHGGWNRGWMERR